MVLQFGIQQQQPPQREGQQSQGSWQSWQPYLTMIDPMADHKINIQKLKYPRLTYVCVTPFFDEEPLRAPPPLPQALTDKAWPLLWFPARMVEE